MSGPLESSITLEEVFAVVSAKRVPLAPELAGYLALEISEGAGAAPGEIDPKQVYIGDEGSVALVRPPKPSDSATPRDTEGSIRGILQRLLEASGSQTPALGAAARRGPGAGMPALSQELEAALIPVNRAAGRRALARLAREVKRVTLGVGRNVGKRPPSSAAFEDEPPTTARREIPQEIIQGMTRPEPPAPAPAPPPAAPPTPSRQPLSASRVPPPAVNGTDKPRDEVDSLLSAFEVSDERADDAMSRDLKAIAGIDMTPPPPTRLPVRRPEPEPDDGGIESLLAMTDTAAAPAASKSAAPPEPTPEANLPVLASAYSASATPLEPRPQKDPPPRKQAPSFADDRQLPTGPTLAKTRHKSDSFERPKPKRKSTDLWLFALLLLLLGGGVVGLWFLKPGFLSGRTPEKIAAEKAAAEKAAAEAAKAREANRTCKATLTISDAPPNSEVLLRVGQAPVEVPQMPVGTRLEFVATAEGHAPKRAVVPAGANWDPGPDGKPRYDLAVQLDRSKAKAGAVDSWPAGDPGSEVGGKGAPGTVRVVSTPRGAEVWLLTGLGPEATIEQLPCKGDFDVLVAGPTTYRKRLHVREADFADAPAEHGELAKKASISSK